MTEIRGDVSVQVIRADLRVGETLYRSVGVHGSGGLLRDSRQPAVDVVRAEIERRAREGRPALIWTVYRATIDAHVYVDAGAIEILGAVAAEKSK